MDSTPRSSRQLLADPAVGPYFVSRTLSSTGIWIHNVAAAIVVYELSGSAFLVGAISVAQFMPQVILAPWGGVRADRKNRKHQAIVGRTACAVGAIGLALWIAAAGSARLDPLHVIGAALLIGIGFAVSLPALHALMPSIVGPRELASIVTLDSIPAPIARAVGPAVGALLLAAAGPVVAFGVAGGTQVIFAVAIWRLRPRSVDRSDSSDKSLLAGFRHLRENRQARHLIVGVAGIGIGVDPVITLTPPLVNALGGAPHEVGLLVSAFGLGAVSAAPCVGLLRRRTSAQGLGTLGLSILASSLVAVAISPYVWLAAVSFFIGGMGMLMGITGFTVDLQQNLPEGLRGRIMAIWSIAFIGSRPFAATLNGAVTDFYSVEVALYITCAILWVITIASRRKPSSHH